MWGANVESWELHETMATPSPICAPRGCAYGRFAVDQEGQCWSTDGLCHPDWSEGPKAESCARDGDRANREQSAYCEALTTDESCTAADCIWSREGEKLLESGCTTPVFWCLSGDKGCANSEGWAITPNMECVHVGHLCGLDGWIYEGDEASACRQAHESAQCDAE